MLIEMVGSVTAQSAHAILAKFHEETHDLSTRIELRALVNSVQSEIPSHLSCDANFKFFFPFLFNYPRRTIGLAEEEFNLISSRFFTSHSKLSFLYLMENYRITLPFVMRMKEKLQRS